MAAAFIQRELPWPVGLCKAWTQLETKQVVDTVSETGGSQDNVASYSREAKWQTVENYIGSGIFCADYLLDKLFALQYDPACIKQMFKTTTVSFLQNYRETLSNHILSQQGSLINLTSLLVPRSEISAGENFLFCSFFLYISPHPPRMVHVSQHWKNLKLLVLDQALLSWGKSHYRLIWCQDAVIL